MQIIMPLMLILLLVLAIAVTLSKKLLPAVMIFMFYSLVMSAIWLLLESPDLAITEAAVGAGITSVLFFITLKRLNAIGAPRKAAEGLEDEDGLNEDEAEVEALKRGYAIDQRGGDGE
ncbi:MAG: DUF4040 domain-containing protein [Firmicutes bacterium]|nr:DUF4040 domain-containing protein [Bacillota bacterium]